MDKKFVTFLLVAFIILTVNTMIMSWMAKDQPQPRPGDQQEIAVLPEEDAQPEEDKEGEKPPDAQVVPDRQADVKPVEEPEMVAPEPVEYPQRWVPLGSADPDSGYRMLVMLTSRGAAIERIELSGEKFRDLENTTGYLGHLGLSDDTGIGGVRVGVVGPGTPAAKAGLQNPVFINGKLAQNDVIIALGEERTPNTDAFNSALEKLNPDDSVSLEVIRVSNIDEEDGEQTQEKLPPLTVVLGRYPLQVVRPEDSDPTSFLLSLAQIDGKKPVDNLHLVDGNWKLEQNNDTSVTFSQRLDSGIVLSKRYGLKKMLDCKLADAGSPGYDIDFDINIGLEKGSTVEHTVAYQLDGPTGLPAEGEWYANKISPHWGGAGIRDVVAGRFDGKRIKYEFISAATIADEDEFVNPDWVPLSYIGGDAQYFSAVLIPNKTDPADKWFASAAPVGVSENKPDNARLLNTSFRLISQPQVLQPGGEPISHSFKLFAGPKKPALLAEYGLTDLVQYGWFHWVARPMLSVLHFFYGIVGNYGLAIIMLTVMVRMCMFPLSRKQALGAQKMQQLAPEMKAIADKYKKNPEQRMKAQKELFSKHNYNPLAGCLPLFIQMPIFIGLYRSLMVDVELRQAPLIPGLSWCSNLAAPDMIWHWVDVMPGFVVHFLGPYLNVLPLITVGLFLWQQKMFMPPPTDDQSAMQQKMMRYMMIFMAFLFFKVASGLCLYFIASSLWGIAERKLLPKTQPAAGKVAETKPRSAPRSSSNGNGAPAARKKKQRGRK